MRRASSLLTDRFIASVFSSTKENFVMRRLLLFVAAALLAASLPRSPRASRLDQQLAVATVAESVDVKAGPPAPVATAAGAMTLRVSETEALPVRRTPKGCGLPET
jgi:hypothetical protein